MKLLLVDNVHMYKAPDGEYYTPSIYNETFFNRYLSVFDQVKIVAKTKHINESEIQDYIHVKFDNVEVYDLTWYKGIKDLIKNIPTLIPQFRSAADDCDCIIYRVAQIESFLVEKLIKKRLPYALEVVNDPESWDFVCSVIKRITANQLRRMCRKANGVSYVTENFLQRKYPCSAKAFTSSYSSIELDDKYISSGKEKNNSDIFKLVHVSNSVDGNEKGHDTAIKALKQVIENGRKAEIYFIGCGPGISVFQEMAKEEGIDRAVHFLGRISDKDEYMIALSKYDALIFPSHSEGLPRVVIESMACGLPCIASPVGGTAELIEDEWLVDFMDFQGYASAIERLIDDDNLYHTVSSKNIETAKKYKKSVLDIKRKRFYQKLVSINQS